MQSKPRSSFWELPFAAGVADQIWILNFRWRDDGLRLCRDASSRDRVPAFLAQHSGKQKKEM